MSDAPERNINLDKARAARVETLGPAPTVTFKDVTFELPQEMPFAFVEALYLLQVEDNENMIAQSGILTEMSAALFGERTDEFRKLHPSVPDFETLMEAVAMAYSASPGESSASEN